jgi:hypothetical protein
MGALQIILAYLIAMSLASERLVTIVKTVLPKLAEEKKTKAQEVDLFADRWRRIGVLALALVSSWITVGLSSSTNAEVISLENFLPFTRVTIGTLSLPLILVAVLISGGSAFWNNLLGYTKAIKDTKQVEKASETLKFHGQAKGTGAMATDSGESAGSNKPS